MHKTIKKKYPSVVMPRVTMSRLDNSEIISIDNKYIKNIIGNEPVVSRIENEPIKSIINIDIISSTPKELNKEVIQNV